MFPLTKSIGEFIAGMRFEAVPGDVLPMIRNGFADYAGAVILGRDTPIARLMKSVSSLSPQGGEARVCFSHEGAAAGEAALINGAAGHALDSLQARHVALIRYAGQSGTVEVAFTPPADHNALDAEFKAQHQRLYGFVTDEPWELETLRLTVSAATGNDINVPLTTAAPATMVAPETQCWFDRDRSVTTPRYPRETLAAKQKIEGPAIIEDQWSTTVVPPGATAWSDLSGHIHIDTGGAA